MTRTLVAEGVDTYGDISIYKQDPDEAEQCIYCGSPSVVVLEYNSPGPKLPEGIDVTATILCEDCAAIGVTCGCYAKFHRQVAHIKDKLPPKPSIQEQLEGRTDA